MISLSNYPRGHDCYEIIQSLRSKSVPESNLVCVRIFGSRRHCKCACCSSTRCGGIIVVPSQVELVLIEISISIALLILLITDNQHLTRRGRDEDAANCEGFASKEPVLACLSKRLEAGNNGRGSGISTLQRQEWLKEKEAWGLH